MAPTLGIDIGGSGIKGAPVDLASGRLTSERVRLPTPKPSKPVHVADVVSEVVDAFETVGTIGCTFPAIVREGVVYTAANVDESWIGVNATEVFADATGRSFVILNDADAAGLAEMRWGAGQGKGGVVIALTFGTGIGSAIFVDGQLLPNSELGHLEFRGDLAEHYAAADVRKELDLTFDEWGDRVNDYLAHLDRLFSPDLFILGGGVSKRFVEFATHLVVGPRVVPALLKNDAGIAGAALVAATG